MVTRMMQKTRNKLTLSILGKLKDKGIPPMGEFDEESFDMGGGVMGSGPNMPNLRRKRPEDDDEGDPEAYE